MHAETVSISKDGTLYLPDKLGRIWTSKDGGKGKLEELGYAGGRPLGGHVYPNGDAIFCDMVKVCHSRCKLTPWLQLPHMLDPLAFVSHIVHHYHHPCTMCMP